ncbi:MAG: mRNA-decapping enzyme subunit 1 [archaeon]|nr:mRNA-decapping enzyme subunit 1 [archaeon]
MSSPTASTGSIVFSAQDQKAIDALNLRVLRRKDPSVSKVLTKSSHVSLYEYSAETKQWNKQEVQGPLFIVERATLPPSYRILVANKQNPNDFALDLTLATKFRCQNSILMLRSPMPSLSPSSDPNNLDPNLPPAPQPRVDGLWFYDAKEQQRVHDLLTDIAALLTATSALLPPPSVLLPHSASSPSPFPILSSSPLSSSNLIQSQSQSPSQPHAQPLPLPPPPPPSHWVSSAILSRLSGLPPTHSTPPADPIKREDIKAALQEMSSSPDILDTLLSVLSRNHL